ncbi:MAG: DNA polymerase III subunit delta [Bacteroidota bacterium]
MADKGFDEIIRDLKNKIYSPIYFLQGEEAYYIDELSDYLEKNVLDEMEKEFNQTILYGRETETLALLSTAKRYPMMANYSVVIVKEAQDLKYFKKEMGKSDPDPLLNYMLNPSTSTVLVFCYKYDTVDKRTKFYKSLQKHAVIFESKKIYDNKIPDWVSSYLQHRGVKIKIPAAQLIADYLGSDLSKVANECDKLLLNVAKGAEIDVLQIEQNIGISKDFNVFELNTALAKRQGEKVFRIANYFKSNTKANPLVVTIGTLYSFFTKVLLYHSLTDRSKGAAAAALGVNPFFIGDYDIAARNFNLSKSVGIISLLREYDLKSKGIDSASVEEGDLLRELLYKILN